MDAPQLGQLRNAVEAIANLKARDAKQSDPTSATIDDVIPKIRRALLRDFEASTRRYLTLRNALVDSGVPLPALSVCGRGTQEIRYTQLTRYFLDPRQTHGLGSKPLVALLTPELDAIELTVNDVPWEGAIVEAEVSLGPINVGKRKMGSTLDILIQAGDLIVLIENKIRSAESGSIGAGELSQLKRYSEAFARHFPELQDRYVLKIFLTPEGRAPKEDSDWIPLSHGTVLERFAQALEDEKLSRIARHNLASFMWDLMCGPLAFGGRERDELVARLTGALEDHDKLIALRAWCGRNVPFFDIMLRTVEICHG